MAIFHSHVQVISRGKGKSAVAAAAYRAGELIKNDYDGIIHDYTRKGNVVYTEILLPAHAPADYFSRAILWNAVEKIEKAGNAQLARELDIALPAELTREQNINLIRDYVKRTFVSAGMCADLCIHDKDDSNPHVHIMLTMRPLNDDGTWSSKQKKEYILDSDGNKTYDPVKRQYKCRSIPSTDWNGRDKADEWRKAWEEAVNAELKRLDFDSRIDRRTYAEQGIEKVPTIHMGVAAMQMERRGIRTGRGDINREIAVTNKQLWQLRARMDKLSDWLKEETVNAEPPTLADVLDEIMSRQDRSKLSRLKSGAEILNFLQTNAIYDMAALEIKVNAMHGKLYSASEELKKVERRVDALKEHLRQSGHFKEHQKLKRQYDKLYAEYTAAKKETGLFAERKAKKALETANAFYEANRTGLTLYDAAEKYLRGVLQEHFNPKNLPPITKWREELTVKTAAKESLYREYYVLKDETYKVEKIRASVKAILHNEMPERISARTQGMEL